MWHEVKNEVPAKIYDVLVYRSGASNIQVGYYIEGNWYVYTGSNLQMERVYDVVYWADFEYILPDGRDIG